MKSQRKHLNRFLLDSVVGRDFERVSFLINAGADVNARNPEHGETPLILAAQFADAALLRRLIESGAEIDARDSFGRTALFYVAARSDEFAVLLSSGADVHVTDKEGNSVLIYKMTAAPSLEEVNALLELGVDHKIKNENEETALSLAERLGLIKVVERLSNL